MRKTLADTTINDFFNLVVGITKNLWSSLFESTVKDHGLSIVFFLCYGFKIKLFSRPLCQAESNRYFFVYTFIHCRILCPNLFYFAYRAIIEMLSVLYMQMI